MKWSVQYQSLPSQTDAKFKLKARIPLILLP